jgi:hypothetical protein
MVRANENRTFGLAKGNQGDKMGVVLNDERGIKTYTFSISAKKKEEQGFTVVIKSAFQFNDVSVNVIL